MTYIVMEPEGGRAAQYTNPGSYTHEFNDHFATGVCTFLNKDSDVKGKPNVSWGSIS